MDFFPAFLKLDGKPCLLVGGGKVAARKARLLLSANARLTIVAPRISHGVAAIVASGRAAHRPRRFRDADVAGHWLVVSATGDRAVETRVAEAAKAARVFVNCVDDTGNCSYITPAIVDRSPLVIAISSAGSAPVLARRIRATIESLLPHGLGGLAALAGRWRQEVSQRLPSFGARLRFWEQIFDGSVAGAAQAGDLETAETLLADTLEAGAADAPGEAWLVGAGPGDPDLLTLKALQAMQRADVILHDRLVSDEVLAMARRDAERIAVGKAPGRASVSQGQVNAMLVELVSSGKRVCRLKGGDPFIFGRGGEEAEVLRARGLTCHVVPGITAAAGCAAAAGIPLTHRDDAQSVAFVTAHGRQSTDSLDWQSLARDRQTLAVYMGVRRFPDIMRHMIDHGRPADTPVAIVERGTTPRQRVVRGRLGQLAMLAEAYAIESPAMLYIGGVASRGAGPAAAAAGTVEPLAEPESVIQGNLLRGAQPWLTP